MDDRPPYLPTKEQRAEVLAALAENATYGEGLDAVERLTVQAVAEWMDGWIHDGEIGAKYVVEQFIREAKGKSDG